MAEQRFCPILLQSSAISDVKACTCGEEQCAWYCKSSEECAIKEIAMVLKYGNEG